MSELIAEARVLVTPDTTAFRQLLTTELAAITRTIPPVPVQIAPVVSTAGFSALAAQQQEVAGATRRLSEETQRKAAADRAAAAAAATHNRQLAQTRTGAASAIASLVGLRGATLAASSRFLVGAAGAIAFTKALSTFASFEQQLNVFAATTGATADEITRVSEAAKTLGRDITLPGVSAGDAAESMTEFAKAGLSVEDAMSAARGGLQLATAAQISNAEAVELAASALNAFNLEGEDAVRVADVLANAANLAQGSIQDTALALRQAAGAAAVVGVSFEDTVALLTLLARNGLTGSDAGTALRTAFIRLVNPSKEANAILKDLNVNLRDINGNVRPQVFAEFAAAQANLSQKTQQANAAIVFGQDAFRAFGFLGREGAAGLNEVSTGLERTGTAAEIAGARTQGLTGSIENLRNQLSSLGLTVGEVVGGPMTSLFGSIARVTGQANDAIIAFRGFAEAVGDLPDIVPQIKIGPIDTTEIDRSSTDFDARFREALTEKLSNPLEIVAPILRLQRVEAEVDTEEAQDEIEKIKTALEEAGATPLSFQEAVLGLQELRKRIEENGGSATELTDTLAVFITQLQDLSAQADIELPIKLPPELVNGRAGEDAGRATARGFARGFDFGEAEFGFQSFVNRMRLTAEQGFAAAARAAAAAFTTTVQQATTSAISGLDLSIARAAGDEGGELRILREREARQDAFLENVLRREQTPKNVALAEKAARNLEETRNAISAILTAQANAAKTAAAKVTADAAAADRTFLEGLAAARQNQENQIAIAAQRAGTADDLREQRELRELIQKQIEAIRASSVAEKTKQDAIRALTAAKIATTGAIKQLAATAAAERSAQRIATAELNFSTQELLAQLTESDKDNERVLRAQIRFFSNEAKRLGLATDAGKQARIRALQFVVQLRELLKARAEAAGELEDSQQGTSVADLLRENARIFAQSAGNVIGGDQPFDSPAAFSSSLARFLTPVSGKPQIEVVAKRDTATSAIDRQIQKLIDALNLNTNALTGGGASTSDRYADVLGKRGQAMAAFYESRVARDRVDARRSGI